VHICGRRALCARNRWDLSSQRWTANLIPAVEYCGSIDERWALVSVIYVRPFITARQIGNHELKEGEVAAGVPRKKIW
jgi:hypothetical protein